MSHELKQPLNLIQVNADRLVRLSEARESSTVQRIGSTIVRAGRRKRLSTTCILCAATARAGSRLPARKIAMGHCGLLRST
jgi:two-component system CheB/CheR fusion protein